MLIRLWLILLSFVFDKSNFELSTVKKKGKKTIWVGSYCVAFDLGIYTLHTITHFKQTKHGTARRKKNLLAWRWPPDHYLMKEKTNPVSLALVNILLLNTYMWHCLVFNNNWKRQLDNRHQLTSYSNIRIRSEQFVYSSNKQKIICICWTLDWLHHSSVSISLSFSFHP